VRGWSKSRPLSRPLCQVKGAALPEARIADIRGYSSPHAIGDIDQATISLSRSCPRSAIRDARFGRRPGQEARARPNATSPAPPNLWFSAANTGAPHSPFPVLPAASNPRQFGHKSNRRSRAGAGPLSRTSRVKKRSPAIKGTATTRGSECGSWARPESGDFPYRTPIPGSTWTGGKADDVT
jgi:hypothetical protein